MASESTLTRGSDAEQPATHSTATSGTDHRRGDWLRPPAASREALITSISPSTSCSSAPADTVAIFGMDFCSAALVSVVIWRASLSLPACSLASHPTASVVY